MGKLIKKKKTLKLYHSNSFPHHKMKERDRTIWKVVGSNEYDIKKQLMKWIIG